MDPHDLLAELCRRHGLERAEHIDLLPLAERAVVGPLEDRERLLVLLGEALALRARKERGVLPAAASVDEGLLLAVARALHGWAAEDGPLQFRGDGNPETAGD